MSALRLKKSEQKEFCISFAISVLLYYTKNMAKNPDLVYKLGNEVHNWFNTITKEIEKKHPDITWGYDKNDKTWAIFSRQNTLLLRMGLDLTNKVFVYEYLADIDGKLDLKTGSTKEKRDLLNLLPKLEEVDAYNK